MTRPRHPAHALLKAFGIQRIADHFGVIHYAAWKWANLGVPAERAVAVARLIECRPHDLRPDLYGPEDTGPVANTHGRSDCASDNPVMPVSQPAGGQPATL